MRRCPIRYPSTLLTACLAGAPALAAPTFTERVVDPSLFVTTGALATDLDADGDTDILVTALNLPGVAWYENDGAETPTLTERLIPVSAPGARALASADVDGDGDNDLVVSLRAPERLVWLERVGGPGVVFVERPLWDGANGARRITILDFDADGDPDVVAAGQYGVSVAAWIENVRQPGGATSFIEHVIPCSPFIDLSATAGDLDADGDPDVVVAQSAVFGAGWIGWLENQGPAAPGGAPSFVEHPLEASQGGEHNATVVDLDADGDADILTASFHAGRVAWFENTSAPGAPRAFVRRAIASGADGASEAQPADLDGDGDLDVLTAMYHDGEVRWHERTGSGWASHLLRAGVINAEHVSVGDIDADGDLDPVAALFDSVTWYDNSGPACPGDANGDASVNFADLNIVLASFGQTGAPGSLPGDLDGDGVVGFADLNEVLSFFGSSC